MLELLPALVFPVMRILPIAIVYMIGLTIAFSNRNRYPKASLFVLSGLGILLVSAILSIPVQTMPLLNSSHSPAALGIALSVVNLLLNAVYVIGMVLTVVAIFVDRK